MNPKVLIRCFKIMTSVIAAITAVSLVLSTSIASAAQFTVFQKGKTPIVFNLATVKDLTFTDGSPVIKAAPKGIVYFINAVQFSGRINFTLSGSPGTIAELKLFNTGGRLLYSRNCRISADGTTHLSIPQVAHGIYIARFINEKHIISKPVFTY